MSGAGIEIKLLHMKSETAKVSHRIELFYVLEGKFCITLRGKVSYFKKNDILVINSGEAVDLTVLQESVAGYLIIEGNVFEEVLGTEVCEFNCNSSEGEDSRYTELRIYLNELLRDYLQNGSKMNFGQVSKCYNILNYLMVHFLDCSSEKQGEKQLERYEKRIQRVIRYVQENYDKQISLTDLSNKLYVTDSHLSRVIKKELGEGFREYVNRVRLQHAVEDLLYTDKSILRVANDNGFSGLAMFNKIFKEIYGKTPTAYKKEMCIKDKKQEHQKEEVIQKALMEVESYLARNEKREVLPEKITETLVNLNISKGEFYTKPWKRMINAGTAPELLNYKVRKHIVKLKEELDFTYVRVWGIFHDEMMVLPQEDGARPNFDRIDDIIGFLLENHMKPFLQVGPKPRNITRSPGMENVLNVPNITLYAYDNEQWRELINQFVGHLVSRFGGQEVESWIFEMWSPCDWDGEWSCWYSEERFAVVYETVKKYVPGALVGGCEFTLSAHSLKLKEIVQNWKQKNISPDFISFSAFPYMRDGRTRWITESDYLKKEIEEIKVCLNAAGIEQSTLFLTTWNNTISNRNILNDTVYKGAYLIKSAIDAINSVDMLGYWLCSDTYSEYYDSTGLLFGGAGLVGKDGIYKPSFYAFLFLKKLKSKLIGCGENYVVTGDSHGNVTIVYHNLKTLTYEVYLKPEDKLTYQEMENIFVDTKTLKLRFEMNGLQDGIYNIRTQKVNTHSGSVLDEWYRIGGFHELMEEDRMYLNQISIPRKEMFRAVVNKGHLGMEIEAEANEFGIIEIFPVAH